MQWRWLCSNTLQKARHITLPNISRYKVNFDVINFWSIFHQPNRQHLFLQGESSIYINSGDMILPNSESSNGSLFSNRHWQTIQVTQTYINANWPIRVWCFCRHHNLCLRRNARHHWQQCQFSKGFANRSDLAYLLSLVSFTYECIVCHFVDPIASPKPSST